MGKYFSGSGTGFNNLTTFCMYQITNETPVAALTVGQFKELFLSTQQPQAETPQPAPQTERKQLNSIRELADFLSCSAVTAFKFKKAGLLPCHQMGRKVIFFSDEVLAAMDQTKRKNRK